MNILAGSVQNSRPIIEQGSMQCINEIVYYITQQYRGKRIVSFDDGSENYVPLKHQKGF